MNKIITDINQLDLQENFTYADYLAWRFEERVELIDGKLCKTPLSPSLVHQDISVNLTMLLGNFLYKSPYKLYHAPQMSG